MPFLKNKPSLKSLRARLSGSSKPEPEPSTNNLPAPRVKRKRSGPLDSHPVHPINGGEHLRESRAALFSVSGILRAHNLTMSASATITFSQPGVPPPVSVVTSASDPPWEPLEMGVTEYQSWSGDPMYIIVFPDVAEGEYQYKIRDGDGNWVIDESREIALDELGNRNNVVRTTSEFKQKESPSSDAAAAERQNKRLSVVKEQNEPDRRVERQDSTQLPSGPLPFIVVNKAEDQAQPDYGDVEPDTLPVDKTKRTTDADVDKVLMQGEPQSSPSGTIDQEIGAKKATSEFDKIPLLPHEAHDSNVSSSSNITDSELSSGPFLPHETPQSTQDSDDEPRSDPSHPLESGVLINTKDDTQNPGELGNTSLLSHETGFSTESKTRSEGTSELSDVPLMSHKTGFLSESNTTSEGLSEAGRVPPMSHEAAVLTEKTRLKTEEETGEFGNAPMIPHEAASATQNDNVGDRVSELDNGLLMSHEAPSGNSSQGKYLDDELGEFNNAPPMSHETGMRSNIYSELDPSFPREDDAVADGDHGTDEDPLLPHERPHIMGERPVSQYIRETGQLPATSYEAPKKQSPIFNRRACGIWKTRSSSSSLPHSLPRSDAEDANLQDPSLEVFPTQRERIFERVATISTHLPEDEAVHSPSDTHSPQFSVLSQACSSVDLAQVGSHTSLHCITEDAVAETEEDEGSAVESPVLELPVRGAVGTSGEASSSKNVVGGDEVATPMPQDDRGEYFNNEAKSQKEDNGVTETNDTGSQKSSAVASVQKNDGAGDGAAPAIAQRWTPDAISRPASALDPITTKTHTPWERLRVIADERAAAMPKGPPKIHFLEPVARADRPTSPQGRRPNIFVRAWRQIKELSS